MNEVIALTNSGGGGVADGFCCRERWMLCDMRAAILPPSQNGSVRV
jgi:hypothetical protein